MAACTSCGDAIDLGDAFCTSCGAKQVSPAEAEAWSGPPEPPVTGAVATVAQAPPSGMSERTLPFTSPIGEQSPSIRNPDLLASDELLGQAAPNTVYLGQRMMYEKEQQLEEFDPLRSGRFVLEMLRRAFVTWLIWVVGLIPVFVVATILGFANHSFGIAVRVLIFLAWCFIMLCAFWLPKLPGQLSEWKFAVDDRGSRTHRFRSHCMGPATSGNPHGLLAATTVQSRRPRFPRPARNQAKRVLWTDFLLQQRRGPLHRVDLLAVSFPSAVFLDWILAIPLELRTRDTPYT